MQVFPVSRDGLDCVANGVAVVKNGAQPAFTLVLRDYLGLNLATLGDNVCHALCVESQQLRQCALESAEQRCVVNDPVLNHLGKPGA